MAYEAEGRKIAADLAAQCGRLLEVRLESKSPSRIVLLCERQEITLPNEFMFKFGYSGSGPDCFHAFLQAAGFHVTKEQVETAKEGDILKP
ncbi:MAG: hypothetical protein NTW95_01420 [Candidatus Aminicenantes bacterium]|nr:hypothetical protein [Candidatus Aminicenantes bacterium]